MWPAPLKTTLLALFAALSSSASPAAAVMPVPALLPAPLSASALPTARVRAAAAAPAQSASIFEVPRRAGSWQELCEVFDPRWTLPEPPFDARKPDLVSRAKALAAERWPDVGDERLRSLGDLVAAARSLSDRARRGLLETLREAQPAAWERWGELLSELLLDDALRSRGWNGDDDEDDDGLFLDDPWTISKRAPAPWNRIEGSRSVQQAAALIFADLQALKQAENDYVTYPGYANSEYEAIYPVEGSYVAAAPVEGEPQQVALQLHFRVDLPFPFSDCTCRLQIRNRLDADGHLVTDVASTSADYLWLGGRDVFVPLSTSDGQPAGLLAVRWFGFDVDGVPDGDGARRAGLRGGLGRLKRRAEDEQALHEGGYRSLQGAIPEFPVRGDRRWKR